MKLIFTILLILNTANAFAGDMSTISYLVREAASEDYGYIFYDEWELKIVEPTKGCFVTVTASTNYYLKKEKKTINAVYCLNRGENQSYIIKQKVIR